MKILMLLLTVTALQVSASSYGQKVSLFEKNIALKGVLKKIEKQTGYFFWYEESLVRDLPAISVEIKNEPLHKALNICFANTPLSYEIINKTILLKAAPAKLSKKREPVLHREKIKPRVEKITGFVTDSTGSPISNVSVLVKGTSLGTVTDANGQFTIDAAAGSVLVFSYVGYKEKEVRIIAASRKLHVVLEPKDKEIESVVVTALGIKRAEKSLTYNVQSVAGTELTRNKDANFVNSLVGKVAGVTINSSSTGIGGATRVIMRGTKSITGNNNALYVIDGIPVLNTTNLSTNGPAGNISNLYAGNTGSDIISMIDPENIESISVLTGAAAAALYGSQAQNGAVIINTKTKHNGKPSLTFFNNTTFFEPFVMPEFQNTYGQTEEGSYYSWGEKLSQPSDYRPKDFFQTGNNTTTGLSFSEGTEKNQTFVSATLLNANGIIPNNTVKRYNFSARNITSFLDDKLTLDINTMYILQDEKNMVAQGLYHNPLVSIYLFPPGGDIDAFKVYERYDPSRGFPVQYWPYLGDPFQTENPWWIINRETAGNQNKRLLLGATLKYTVSPWMNITARGKFDQVNIENETKRYASTDRLFAGYGGGFDIAKATTEQLYGDIIANIDKGFGDYRITANIGGQRTESASKKLSAGGYIREGSPPNVFTTDNVHSSSGAPGAGLAQQGQRTSFQSVFVSTNISYKNFFFLEGGFRRDWYSQLYYDDNSKLYLDYPSLGTSIILSDLLQLRSDAVSYIKLRGAYSLVGNPPRIYQGGPPRFRLKNGAIDQGSLLSLPLSPERTKAYEAGINLRLLKNKVRLDVTLYNTDTYDQIFQVSQSSTSGGNSSFLINAGHVNNKGIEGALGFQSRAGAINWSSTATFTINKNTLKKLYSTIDASGNVNEVKKISLGGTSSSYTQATEVGGNLSSIVVTSQLLRDQQGFLIVSPGVKENDKVRIYVGNADPKYTLGWNNGFGYKNADIHFTIFARVGGVGVSATQAMLDAYGVSQTSAQTRDKGYIEANGSQYKNIEQYYTTMGSGVRGVLSQYVYSATNVRLKELSIGYTIPGKLLGNIVKGLRVSLVGNNLFMFYNKAPFDPESTASTGTYYQGIDYFRQPSLRSIGFSINAKF